MIAQLCFLHGLDADGTATLEKSTVTAAPCPSDTQSKLQCYYMVFYYLYLFTCCVLSWKHLTDNSFFLLSLDYLNSDPCSCSDWLGPTFSSLMDVFLIPALFHIK